jgi:hypothetical protein
MKTVSVFIPTLAVGSQIPNCFGKLAEVVEVRYNGTDVNGKAFVGFATRFGPTSTISGSMKEGELYRSSNLSRYFTSNELRAIEADMNAKGETEREIEVPE